MENVFREPVSWHRNHMIFGDSQEHWMHTMIHKLSSCQILWRWRRWKGKQKQRQWPQSVEGETVGSMTWGLADSSIISGSDFWHQSSLTNLGLWKQARRRWTGEYPYTILVSPPCFDHTLRPLSPQRQTAAKTQIRPTKLEEAAFFTITTGTHLRNAHPPVDTENSLKLGTRVSAHNLTTNSLFVSQQVK